MLLTTLSAMAELHGTAAAAPFFTASRAPATVVDFNVPSSATTSFHSCPPLFNLNKTTAGNSSGGTFKVAASSCCFSFNGCFASCEEKEEKERKMVV